MKKRILNIFIIIILSSLLSACSYSRFAENMNSAIQNIIERVKEVSEIESKQESEESYDANAEADPEENDIDIPRDSAYDDNTQTQNNSSNTENKQTKQSRYSARETALADSVLSQIITSGMGEFEKVKAIHDYLVMNVDYDYRNYRTGTIPDSSHTAIGALENKVAVCDGYANAFQLLCERAGIDSVFTYGYAKGEAHAWNQVKIEGNWYNIDVTWDDPAPSLGEKDFNDHSGNSYRYFCIPNSIMYQDHDPENAQYTCTAAALFERALKAGIPWEDAAYVSAEEELLAFLKAEAAANNAAPVIYCKESLITGTIAEYIGNCMAKCGIYGFTGVKYETYYAGTTSPGAFYKIIIQTETQDGKVQIYPVVSTMEELKTELLRAYKAGQTSCSLYIYKASIPWDNGKGQYTRIIFWECWVHTYMSSYYQAASGVPQFTIFEFAKR